MSFEYSPYVLPLIAAAFVSVAVAIYAWMRRLATGALPLFLLAVSIFIWVVGYALEITGTDLETKYLWGAIQYVGIAFSTYSWLMFSIVYSDQAKIITRRFIAWTVLIPVITVFLALTTKWHGLIWSEYHIEKQNDFSALGVSHGPWFFVHFSYSYLILLIGAVLLARVLWRRRGMYRGQVIAMLVAVLAPWISNILYLTGNSPIPYLDPTSFAFTITVAALAWAIFGFHLVDITPLARDRVLDSMREGMIVLDVRGNVLDINSAAARMIGIPVASAIGRTADDIFHPWSLLVERFRHVMDAKDEISVGEGEAERSYEVRLSPLKDAQGQLMGRLIMLRAMDEEALKQERDLLERLVEKELAERERAQVLLQESESRFRQIVENASDIIYRTDINGNFTYANPSVLKVIGCANEQEVLGKNYLDMTTPEFRHKLKRAYHRQYVSKTNVTYYEFPVVTTDGQIVWIGQNVQLILDGGQIVGFQAVGRDVTQLKQAQESLALSRDQALDASSFKSQLLTRVSHELRTPLGGILGYAELLKYKAFGSLSDNQYDAVDNIVESTNYLTGIVNDLLDISQIESKSLSLHNEYFNPIDLLEKIKTSMSVLADKKGLIFRVEIDPDFPIELYGDVNRLQQIIVNLAGNAIKFTKAGEVSVIFKRPTPILWSVEVCDTGVGISHSEHEAIFEPFRQVDSSITRDNRGSGLGLAITKQLVEIMGGQISLNSEIGKGSLFTVALPITNVIT
jgi:PAS domain S-box-containing protein